MSKALSSEEQFSLDLHDFLDAVQQGVPDLHAAFMCGWTPHQFEKLKRDPEFAELLDSALRYRDLTIEEVAFKKAKEGNEAMIKFWLTNRSEERWTDRRRDAKDVTAVQVNIVATTREALKGLMSGGMSSDMVRQLGPGGVLDVDEADGD